MEAREDPLVERYEPPKEWMAIAHNAMLDAEGPEGRFMRQRWEHAMGAARVAMDSLREIWPSAHASLSQHEQSLLANAHDLAEDLVLGLDRLSEAMLGTVMVELLGGHIRSRTELDQMIQGRPCQS